MPLNGFRGRNLLRVGALRALYAQTLHYDSNILGNHAVEHAAIHGGSVRSDPMGR